eukprot:272622-Chlamydomonas_euryale.AAC.14
MLAAAAGHASNGIAFRPFCPDNRLSRIGSCCGVPTSWRSSRARRDTASDRLVAVRFLFVEVLDKIRQRRPVVAPMQSRGACTEDCLPMSGCLKRYPRPSVCKSVAAPLGTHTRQSAGQQCDGPRPTDDDAGHSNVVAWPRRASGRAGKDMEVPAERQAGLQSRGSSSLDAAMALTKRIVSLTSWQEAEEFFVAHSHSLNHINVAALVVKVSKLQPPAPASPQRITTGVHGSTCSTGTLAGSESRGGWGNQGYADASTTWAAAGRSRAEQDRLAFSALLDELRAIAEDELPHFGPRELANTAHALARLGLADRRYLQLTVGAAGRRLPEFGRQETANLLWALATAQHRPPAGWMDSVISGPATRHLRSFTHQELINALWALATLHFDPVRQRRRTFHQISCARVEEQRRCHPVWPIPLAGRGMSCE